jgi:hypothetical protein
VLKVSVHVLLSRDLIKEFKCGGFILLWGTFAELKKKTAISFVSSACPSAWNNSAPTGRIFMKFYVWGFFERLSRKIQVSLKADKNTTYFT